MSNLVMDYIIKRRNVNKNNIHKIRFGTWNLGTLTGKCKELMDTLKRRKINIACLQETKWKGEKAREIGEGYKLFYSGGIDNRRNGVGIVVDHYMKDKVVDVKRWGDRLMSIKIVLDKTILNIISAYAPQGALDENVKKLFWKLLDEVLQQIPTHEDIFLGGDLNIHVGVERDGYPRIHGGCGFGKRNEGGETILEFANKAYDLALTNTFLKKRAEHLITFKSGENKTQIDY